MITGFIGRVTPAGELKDALAIGTQRVRAIADRVSEASLLNQDGFALPGSAAANGAVMTSAGNDAAEQVPGEMEETRLTHATLGVAAIAALHNLATRLDEELEATVLRDSWRHGERRAAL